MRTQRADPVGDDLGRSQEEEQAERPLLASLAHSMLWDVQPPLIEGNKSLFGFSYLSVTFHHGQKSAQGRSYEGTDHGS